MKAIMPITSLVWWLQRGLVGWMGWSSVMAYYSVCTGDQDRLLGVHRFSRLSRFRNWIIADIGVYAITQKRPVGLRQGVSRSAQWTTEMSGEIPQNQELW